jgi:hypothetical protein
MGALVAWLFVAAGGVAGIIVGVRKAVADSRNPGARQARQPARGRGREVVAVTRNGWTPMDTILTICTAGVWLLVWPLLRRKRVTKIRYR